MPQTQRSLFCRMLTRRAFVVLGFLWGCAALFIGGMVSVPLGRLDLFWSNAGPDLRYHYHLAGIIFVVLALCAFFLFSRLTAASHFRDRLRESFLTMVVMDVAAVVGAAMVVFLLAFLKEVFDALAGKFASPDDFLASVLGCLLPASVAITLMLPVHGLLSLLAGTVRRVLLVRYCHPLARETIKEAMSLQLRLEEQASRMRSLASSPAAAEGLVARGRVRSGSARQLPGNEVAAVRRVAAEVEVMRQEIQDLRASVQKLVKTLRSIPGKCSSCPEVQDILLGSLAQSEQADGLLDNTKQRARLIAALHYGQDEIPPEDASGQEEVCRGE